MDFGVGLFALQSTAMQPTHWASAYQELRDYAVLLEDLGYKQLWITEHHFYYDGFCPSPLIAAASALAATHKLRVGTGVLLLPLYDAKRLAAISHDLNQRSGGRLDIGAGLGFRPVEFAGHGVSKKARLRTFTARLEVLERKEQDGGGPRLWVGTAVAEGAARAGAHGHPIILSGLNSIAVCASLIEAHRKGWEEAGRPGGVWPGAAAYRNIWMTGSRMEREAALDWVRASYVQYIGLGLSVGSAQAATLNFAEDSARAIKTAVDTTITGTVDEVEQQLRQLQAIGFEQVAFRLVLDGAPRAAVESQLRRLATELLPRFRSESKP